jgi:hypothetical protein
MLRGGGSQGTFRAVCQNESIRRLSMPLFLVEHTHTAEGCPTKNREMMLMLGKHVMQVTADQFDVKIHSDVVHPGEHRMMMVLESPDQTNVEEYVKPFGMVGTVDVKPVVTCEQVVETATC